MLSGRGRGLAFSFAILLSHHLLNELHRLEALGQQLPFLFALNLIPGSSPLSLASLNLGPAQPTPFSALERDTNGVTTALPGGFEAGTGTGRPRPAAHSLPQDGARVPPDAVLGRNRTQICLSFPLIQLSPTLKHPPSFA